MNLESGGIRKVYENASSLPFQFLSVLDKDNLVLFEPDKLNDGYVYRVIVYHLITEKTTVVFERTTSIGEEMGEQIAAACAYDGEIYCLMHRSSDEYKMDVLKPDGTLDRTIALDSDQLHAAKTVHETEYGIWKIYVTNGIVWFKTLADTVVPFSLSDGSQCAETLHGYAIRPSSGNPEQSSMLLYQTRESKVSIFSREKGVLNRYDLTVEKDGKAVPVGYAFYANSQNKMVILPWDHDENDNILLYEVKS